MDHVSVGRRRIEDGRLAPRLPRLGGVDGALEEHVVVLRPELLAQLIRGETGQQRVLAMLRRRIREHGEARHGEEALVPVDGIGGDARLRGVALDQGFVEGVHEALSRLVA